MSEAAVKIDDGGRAFPQPETRLGNPMCAEYGPEAGGMSIRMWLAGLAMQGIVAELARNNSRPHFDTVTLLAFEQADSMLDKGKYPSERSIHAEESRLMRELEALYPKPGHYVSCKELPSDKGWGVFLAVRDEEMEWLSSDCYTRLEAIAKALEVAKGGRR